MPSMKLTRLTNHTPATKRHARSIHQGSCGRICNSVGSAAITAPTAMHCRRSRSAAGKVRMSSMAPTKASSAAAAVAARNAASGLVKAGSRVTAHQATTSVATTTAMPPPCGVGRWCDERAFGRSKRVALEPWPQQDDQRQAEQQRGKRHRRQYQQASKNEFDRHFAGYPPRSTTALGCIKPKLHETGRVRHKIENRNKHNVREAEASWRHCRAPTLRDI